MTNLTRRSIALLSVGESFLQKVPARWFPTFAVALTLALSLFFFSPRWNTWDLSKGGSFEVDRAVIVLEQVADPFSELREPAIRFRLLFPIIAHYTGMNSSLFLALPFLGAICLLFYVCCLLSSKLNDRLFAFCGTLLFGTFSSHFVSTQWLGLFDSWYILCLLAATFSQRLPVVGIVSLLGPWIDERFLIGLPLVLFLRWVFSSEIDVAKRRSVMLIILTAVLYLVFRLLAQSSFGADSEHLQSHFTGFHWWLPWAPLGWWMAYRAGWVLPLVVAAALFRGMQRAPLTLYAALLVATFLVVTALASDTSRSAALIAPVMLQGLILLPKIPAKRARALLGGAVLLNLLIPVVHVTYTKVSLISPLLIEVLRLAW